MSESTKGTWNRRRNTEAYAAGFAAIGNDKCEGCRLGLPKRDGEHYQYGKPFCKCGANSEI